MSELHDVELAPERVEDGRDDGQQERPDEHGKARYPVHGAEDPRLDRLERLGLGVRNQQHLERARETRHHEAGEDHR